MGDTVSTRVARGASGASPRRASGYAAAVRISETLEDDAAPPGEDAPGEPVPGLILIWSGERPAFEVIPLEDGAIELGRGEVAGVRIDDKRMSRHHARV